MTDSPIATRIEPSEEILGDDGSINSNKLLDDVDLYNIYDDNDSPEKNAERILNITYPTETLKTIIRNTSRKLDSNDGFSEGAQIIGGEYGSGKSHIQLTLYHLFNSPSIGGEWVETHDIEVDLPVETRTAALQMLNLKQGYDRVSEAVKDYLGIDEWVGDNDVPTVHQIRDTLENEKTLILIDEFERWYGLESREEYKDNNLAFLQNLLEAAGREDTEISVFVSLLYENDDVQAITQRTNPFTHDLGSQRDEKIEFILHRLVGEVTDSESVSKLAKEYTDVYRHNEQIPIENYHNMEKKIEEYYPFHPLTLTLLMQKYSEQEVSSDARGLLRFLAEILGDNYNNTDLILTSDIDVYKYTNRFRYIDRELVGKYVNDYSRLQNTDGSFDELIEELINVVLLHSLAAGGDDGANKRQILLGTMRKGTGAHRVTQTFKENVYGHAWHIHRINGEYAFDTDENPAARIEKKAKDIHKNNALHRVENLIRDDLFSGRKEVHIYDPVNTEQSIPDNKHLKIVVSLQAKNGVTGYQEIFDSLTMGQQREYSNTIVLVTPEKTAGIDSNTGIRELSRKVIAGEKLDREEEVLPDGFEEIHKQNLRNLRDRVRDKYGTVYVSTERGLYPEDLPKGDDVDFYAATIDIVSPDSTLLESEVSDAVEDEGGGGILYEHLRNDFYRNQSYSTLTDEQELQGVIKSLCKQGELKVGKYIEARVGSLGSDTNIVHETYIQQDDDTVDEPNTITVDPVTEDGEDTDNDDSTGSGSTSQEGSDGSGSPDSIFTCPQCSDELTSNECSCGFEFDASDVVEENISVEGATTEELLDKFDLEQPETPTIRPYPAMGAIEKDNKPDLIDKLERKTQGWNIHKVTITVDGVISNKEMNKFSISEHVDGKTSIRQEININTDTPMNHDSFMSVLWDLNVPNNASLAVKLQVDKNE